MASRAILHSIFVCVCAAIKPNALMQHLDCVVFDASVWPKSMKNILCSLSFAERTEAEVMPWKKLGLRAFFNSALRLVSSLPQLPRGSRALQPFWKCLKSLFWNNYWTVIWNECQCLSFSFFLSLLHFPQNPFSLHLVFPWTASVWMVLKSSSSCFVRVLDDP